MTDFGHELVRRLLIEGPEELHTSQEASLREVQFEGEVHERIAATTYQDAVRPIAATAIVRKDAVTEIAPPDVEALLAAFSRPEEDQ